MASKRFTVKARAAAAEKFGREPASELIGLAAASRQMGMKHVQLLEASGLVQTEKVGRVRTCSLNRAALDMATAWLNKSSRQPRASYG